jgi:sugar lactone lactonase YvrE
MLGQMSEIGMDYRRYAAEEGFVIVQGGGYGRRFSTPVGDAVKSDALYREDVKTVAQLGDRGFSLYTDYYEVNDNLKWENLGGKKGYCAFDCCTPSGIYERELYAIAMADSDTSFFVNGGNGWMFGTPPVLSPFLREFRALPALRFTPMEKARDPVAVWTREVKKAEADKLKLAPGFYFYAVNRLPKKVKVELSMANASKVVPAAGGEPLALKNGQSLSFELEPFMLRSFRAEGNGVTIKSCSAETPPELSKKLLPAMAFAKNLLDDLSSRQTAPELSEPDAREAIRLLNESIKAYAEGRIWQAKGNLERSALVRIYDINGRFPAGILERKTPHGFTDKQDAPKLEFPGPQAIIGDLRGRLTTVTDLSYDSEGKLWAASHEQVMLFDKDGKYLKCLSLTMEHKPDEGDPRWAQLSNPQHLDTWSLRIAPDNRLAAMCWHTNPALYETNTGKLLRLEWGYGFPVPGMRSSLLAIDKTGNTYISCPEPDSAKGVYKFQKNGTMSFDYSVDGAPSNRLANSTASGGAIDAKGNIYLVSSDGIKIFSPAGKEIESLTSDEFKKLGKIAVLPDASKILATSSDGNTVLCFEKGISAKFAKAWSFPLPAKASALALSPDLGITVGFQKETNGIVAREYAIAKTGLDAKRDLISGTAAADSSSIDKFTQLKVYDGKICYIAHKKIWKLTPGSEQAELLYDPKFPAHLESFEAFAIAPNGDIYIASHWNGKSRGANVYRAKKEKDGYAALEYLNGGKPLHENVYFIVTDMETDGNDSLILRLHDPEKNPNGRKVSIFRWTPASDKRERLAEVGIAGANYGDYGLCRTADGGLIVAGGTTRSVVRLSKGGDVVWRNSFEAHQGESSTPFRQPIGIAADSKGRIWITEPARNNFICLDSNGKFLKSYGKFGNLDSRDGMSFCRPTGIAAIKDASGVEWLYVADVGNQRIVRFMIK